MKSRVFAAALFGILAFSTLPAESRPGGNFGLGVQIGNPSAISGKLWTGRETAIDMALGFSPWHDWVLAQADYVWHSFNVIPVQSGQLPIYYGMGAMVLLADNPGVGARGTVGIEYLFAKAPLDIFLEVSPGVFVVPSTDGFVGVGLGMRYFF